MCPGDRPRLASDPSPFAAFDFLSLYNRPENDVLALKPSGGPVARGNVTVRLRMVISADMDSVRGVQKQFMNKTHLPLHTSITQYKQTYNILVSAAPSLSLSAEAV